MTSFGTRNRYHTAARFFALTAIVPSFFIVDDLTMMWGKAFGASSDWVLLGPSLADYWRDILLIIMFALVAIFWTLALWRLGGMSRRWRRVFGVLATLSATVLLGDILWSMADLTVDCVKLGDSLPRAIRESAYATFGAFILPLLVSGIYFLVVAYMFLRASESPSGKEETAPLPADGEHERPGGAT